MSVSLCAVWNLPALDGSARDQASRRGLVIQHLLPPKVGKNPLDEILAERHVVEPALLLQGQQRKAIHDLAGEHAGAVTLGHAVLVVDLDAE